MEEEENSTHQVEVTRAAARDKLTLRHLMQLYLYDFSEIEAADVDDNGLFDYFHFDHYWTEPERHPYLVRVAGRPAGFAFVKLMKQDDGTPYTYMAEFFIMRKYRGQGVGQRAAFTLFDQYPGIWEVSEIAPNLAAQAFWRKVIGRYCNGQFEEEIVEDDEVLQRFVSGGDRQASPAS